MTFSQSGGEKYHLVNLRCEGEIFHSSLIMHATFLISISHALASQPASSLWSKDANKLLYAVAAMAPIHCMHAWARSRRLFSLISLSRQPFILLHTHMNWSHAWWGKRRSESKCRTHLEILFCNSLLNPTSSSRWERKSRLHIRENQFSSCAKYNWSDSFIIFRMLLSRI